MKFALLPGSAPAAQPSVEREMFLFAPIARTQSERRRRLSLATRFWLSDCLKLIESLRRGTQITFFRGDDGSVLDVCDLDPADLVPYDLRRYAQMPRRQHCLISASGSRIIGFHLDVWNRVHFDQASNVLSLCVYRPVSDPSGDDRYMVCEIEERWISAEVDI